MEIEDENEDDVFIASKYLKGALNGDEVECEIIVPKGRDRKAEGKVIKILKKANKGVCTQY